MEQTEKQIIEEAEKKAAQIIKDAEAKVEEIYRASLEYVDDMLTEVNIATLRAKESIRELMEAVLEDFDSKVDSIEKDKLELIEQLRAVNENYGRPVKQSNYKIRIDKAYIEKQSVKKQPFEIKIAEEWKDRIDSMLKEREGGVFLEEPSKLPEEEEEPEEGFKASDFDLDNEYFMWKEENN